MADLMLAQRRPDAAPEGPPSPSSGAAPQGGPALVVAVHGSADPRSTAVSEGLRDAVAARLPGVAVRLGWADVLTPSLTDTLAGLGECLVVPVFLSSGFHVRVDLPQAVADSGGRAVLTPPVGGPLLAAVVDRLAQAGGPGDAVVLAAAGSRRAESVAEVRAAASALADLLGRPVEAAFVTSASPTVADAVAGFRVQGHERVSVASYLLAPGVFHGRLRGLAPVVSEPIGVHPRLVSAVVARYRGDHGP